MSGIPWVVLAKLVLFIVYFGVSVLIVNGLGRERFGIYSLMVNISSYMLIICGLGLGAALMRYIPELAVRKNRWALGHLLWKSATLQLIAVLVFSMLLLSFDQPLQRLFKAGHVERSSSTHHQGHQGKVDRFLDHLRRDKGISVLYRGAQRRHGQVDKPKGVSGRLGEKQKGIQ